MRAAIGTLALTFRGASGACEVLFEFPARARTKSLAQGSAPTGDPQQVLEVNRMVAALQPEGSAA